MLLRIQEGGLRTPPDIRKADSLLVMLDNGTPIAVLVNYAEGVFIKLANEPDFAETLKFLGLNKKYTAPDVTNIVIKPN